MLAPALELCFFADTGLSHKLGMRFAYNSLTTIRAKQGSAWPKCLVADTEGNKHDTIRVHEHAGKSNDRWISLITFGLIAVHGHSIADNLVRVAWNGGASVGNG